MTDYEPETKGLYTHKTAILPTTGEAGLMRATFADERGRITLGSKVVDKFGRKFAIVTTARDVVLVPIAEDPLAELQRLGKEAGIDRYTLKELRQMAREEAEKEINRKHVRRH